MNNKDIVKKKQKVITHFLNEEENAIFHDRSKKCICHPYIEEEGDKEMIFHRFIRTAD